MSDNIIQHHTGENTALWFMFYGMSAIAKHTRKNKNWQMMQKNKTFINIVHVQTCYESLKNWQKTEAFGNNQLMKMEITDMLSTAKSQKNMQQRLFTKQRLTHNRCYLLWLFISTYEPVQKCCRVFSKQRIWPWKLVQAVSCVCCGVLSHPPLLAVFQHQLHPAVETRLCQQPSRPRHQAEPCSVMQLSPPSLIPGRPIGPRFYHQLL